jgi:tetratricopeptide (TPR) repeat protein
MGARSGEEEVLIRTQLSEAFEKRSLYREQIEAVAKYEKLAEFSRLSERNKLLVLVRLGWGYSFINDLPRAIALFNQAMKIARNLDEHAGIGACYFGLGRAYRQLSEIRIARDHTHPPSSITGTLVTAQTRRILSLHRLHKRIRGRLQKLASIAQTNAGDNRRSRRARPLGRAHMYRRSPMTILADKQGAKFPTSVRSLRKAGNTSF